MRFSRTPWNGRRCDFLATVSGMDIYTGSDSGYSGKYCDSHKGQPYFAVVYREDRNFVIFKDGTMAYANGPVPDDVPISVIAYARLHL